MMINYDDFSILHGEDDLSDIRMMERILKNIGYKGSYDNLSIGEDVITRLEESKLSELPHLLFLDIGLPGTNGKELLAQLRKDEKTMSIPIIMFSGSISQRDYHECIALGANAYIQKTSDIERLESIVKCFVEGFVFLKQQRFL
jgi:CheY-like chemotaxis protein